MKRPNRFAVQNPAIDADARHPEARRSQSEPVREAPGGLRVLLVPASIFQRDADQSAQQLGRVTLPFGPLFHQALDGLCHEVGVDDVLLNFGLVIQKQLQENARRPTERGYARLDPEGGVGHARQLDFML